MPHTLGNARVEGMQFDWELTLRRNSTKLGRDYWQSRRRGSLMPRRADLDPAGMRNFTTHVGLIDVRREPGHEIDYFIRRAGSSWEEVFGPITGKLIQEFLPPEIETKWRLVFDAVLKRKAPVAVATGIIFQRKSWLEAEMFVGPLGDEQVSMLLMVFDSWSESAL